MSPTRDPIDAAYDSTSRFEQEAKDRGCAPITYQVLFYKDGVKQVITFEATHSTRSQAMRENGVNADNNRWALRTRGTNGRWSNEIIGDKTLAAELAKER